MKWQEVGERGKRRDTKRRGREKGEETLEKGERGREKRRDCHRAQGREARCARRSVRSFVGAAVRVGREGASGYCAPPLLLPPPPSVRPSLPEAPFCPLLPPLPPPRRPLLLRRPTVVALFPPPPPSLSSVSSPPPSSLILAETREGGGREGGRGRVTCSDCCIYGERPLPLSLLPV